MMQNDYREAIKFYQSQVEVNPAIMSNYWHLGLALLLAGEEAEAQLTWLSALAQEAEEESESLTIELGEILLKAALQEEEKHNWQSAWLIRCYAHEFLPNDFDNLLTLSWLSFELSIAEAEIEKFLSEIAYRLTLSDEQSFNIDYLKRLLADLILRNPFHKLFEICLIQNEALSQHPDFTEIRDDLAKVYNIAGVSLNQQGFLSQSLSLFRKAIKVQVNLSTDSIARLHCNAGFTQIELQQLDQAKQALQNAVEFPTKNP